MNNVRLITSEEQYDKIMERVLELAKLDPVEKTGDFEELTILSLLIEQYDDKHYPIPPCNPVEAIKFHMEQNDLRPIDMKQYFGSTSRFYEIINKKRNLSLSMIKKLHTGLRIPYAALLT